MQLLLQTNVSDICSLDSILIKTGAAPISNKIKP